jgi:hypothetical protein
LSDVDLTHLGSESSDNPRILQNPNLRSFPNLRKKNLRICLGQFQKGSTSDQPAKGFRHQSRNSLSSLDQLMELKAKTEELKLRSLASKQQNDKANRKLEVARMALATDNVSEAVKARANDIFLQLMS